MAQFAYPLLAYVQLVQPIIAPGGTGVNAFLHYSDAANSTVAAIDNFASRLSSSLGTSQAPEDPISLITFSREAVGIQQRK